MIETGAFIAGVGILVGLDIACLTAIIKLQGEVGCDTVARNRAEKALEVAREAKHSGQPQGSNT